MAGQLQCHPWRADARQLTARDRVLTSGIVRTLVDRMRRRSGKVIAIPPDACTTLLASLDESREYLRTVDLSGNDEQVEMSRVFYRVETAAATIRWLLQENVDLQCMVSSLSRIREAAIDHRTRD